MSFDQKSGRITRACDTCHKRGRRCRVDTDDSASCLTCREAGLTCTRSRPIAKRGPKNGSKRFVKAAPKNGRSIEQDLEAFLIDAFFDYVYPIVNYVHEKSFRASIKEGKPLQGAPDHALYMAMCALSAYRTAHGTNPSPPHFVSQIKPDHYLQKAVSATHFDSTAPRTLAQLQAIAILCVLGLEIGDANLIQRYMGIYHAALAGQYLSDESRWPTGLSSVEIEQRRRLFWHMYRLEVHIAMVMGHAVRCPELQSMVAYPEGEGEDAADEFEWLSGWNFVTDLYRGLEHLLTKVRLLRDGKVRQRSVLSTTFLVEYDHEDRILAPLNAMYDALPARFQSAAPMSSDVNKNRCGFQTANIVCTFLLLKMVSYSCSRTTLDDACSTALELVERISSIPLDYLRTMSLAMVQELSGFGYILSNFIGKDLRRSELKKLRKVILCLAEFLESLDSNVSYAKRATSQLRDYATTITGMIETKVDRSTGVTGIDTVPDPTFQTSVDDFFVDGIAPILDFTTIFSWMDNSATGSWELNAQFDNEPAGLS